MDPWGTPYVSGVDEEDQLPIVTVKLLSSRYDLSQFKTVPDAQPSVPVYGEEWHGPLCQTLR